MDKRYRPGAVITVHDRMQRGYRYELAAPMGKQFADGFTPHFTPKEMLELGVFEGKYCNDCRNELPEDWFKKAKIGDVADPAFNYFGIKSRQPLSVWREKGWIIGPDPCIINAIFMSCSDFCSRMPGTSHCWVPYSRYTSKMDA